ncbi:hypothetical protein M885DRAFT_613411 [Pelagophyceae sp. CCMP2097]|nr:hypothetical protein M885DRAFT_613411 [Pelagophyceae sp. CCMP2097]
MRLRLGSDRHGTESICVLVDDEWVALTDAALAACDCSDCDAVAAALKIVDVGDFLEATDAKQRASILKLAAAAKREGLGRRAEPTSEKLPFLAKSFRDAALYTEHVHNCKKGFAFLGLREGHALQLLLGQLLAKPLRLPFLLGKRDASRPAYYVGNPLTLVADHATARWPSHAKFLDYELEVALLLTKPVPPRCTAAEAEAAIAASAFVIINDFSARDTQVDELCSVGFGFVKSKSFCTAIGATVVTADELYAAGDGGSLFTEGLRCTVRVNGEQWGPASSTARPRCCTLADYVRFAALDEGLAPGELLGLGTVPFCAGLEIGRWLRPGDTVTVECEVLGSLENKVGFVDSDAVEYKQLAYSTEPQSSRLAAACRLAVLAIVVPPLLCAALICGAVAALFWQGPANGPRDLHADPSKKRR